LKKRPGGRKVTGGGVGRLRQQWGSGWSNGGGVSLLGRGHDGGKGSYIKGNVLLPFSIEGKRILGAQKKGGWG